VFDEPYDRTAGIVGTSEQNARQLATRARRHVQERRGGRVGFEASREQREELATRFFAAAEEGDLQGSRSCWPTTSSSAATAAARRPPPHVRSTAAPG
jgi:hypothetical protein